MGCLQPIAEVFKMGIDGYKSLCVSAKTNDEDFSHLVPYSLFLKTFSEFFLSCELCEHKLHLKTALNILPKDVVPFC